MKFTNEFGKGQILSILEKYGYDFETRKNSFVKYTPLVGALLLALVVFFFASVLPVNASESGTTITCIKQINGYKPNDVLTSSTIETYTFSCDTPIKFMAFRCSDINKTVFPWNDYVRVYVVPCDLTNYSNNVTMSCHNSVNDNTTNSTVSAKTLDSGMVYYTALSVLVDNDNGNGWYSKGSIDVPYMYVSDWDSIDDVFEQYALGNKDAYKDGDDVEIQDYEKLYLKGFTCDNTIQASWTGLLTDLDRVNYNKVFIEVAPLYVVVVNEGQEYVPYSGPGTITVPYNDFSFYQSYESYFIDCPYDECLLFLDFTPVYEFSDDLTLRGQPTTMEFDFNGDLEVVFPSGSLVEEWDPICMFNGAYLNQKGYEYYMFGWDSVASRHDESEIRTTDIKIEVFDNAGVAHVYEPEDFNWSQRFIKLDINQILSFLKAEGVEKWAVISEIRFTPCYTTSTCNHYGRSTLATFENNTDFSELLISNGDAFDSESSVSYAPSPTSPPIEIETVIPDSTIDTEWNIDTMTENFFVMLKNLVTYCGQIPALVAQVFSFLPSVYGSLIVIAFSVCIILRILGR